MMSSPCMKYVTNQNFMIGEERRQIRTQRGENTKSTRSFESKNKLNPRRIARNVRRRRGRKDEKGKMAFRLSFKIAQCLSNDACHHVEFPMNNTTKGTILVARKAYLSERAFNRYDWIAMCFSSLAFPRSLINLR